MMSSTHATYTPVDWTNQKYFRKKGVECLQTLQKDGKFAGA